MNINNFIPLNILITEDLYYKGFKSSVIWTCYSNKMFFWNSFPFFHDPGDVGNLISGSSAFPKTSLNIWKFTVHVLLKPGLENFEHYFT